MVRRILAMGLVVAALGGRALIGAELSVANLAMTPASTAVVIVSGAVNNESTFGVEILVELVPRAGAIGTVTFTSAPPTDITQAGDPWPTFGTFSGLDTDVSGSPLLNGSVDDSGANADFVTYSGPLSSFPVVADASANGVWDVVLATSVADSRWTGLTNVLIAGTITVGPAGCSIDADCDDGSFCNGLEACVSLVCVAGSAPCPGQLCDEVSDVCVDCLGASDCDDGLFCNGNESCVGGACVAGSDPCPGMLCDDALDVCVGQAALISVASVVTQQGATTDAIILASIDGDSTDRVEIFVELIPRAGTLGTVVFTPAPPTDILQIDDPWAGAGSFGAFDTDATGSSVLNGSSTDNGTFVAAPLTFTGSLASFPVAISADAAGVWDVVLATSAGISGWKDVATTLAPGTITVVPAISLSVASLAMPPGGTTNIVVSGALLDRMAFGLEILVELIPRAGAVGTLTFTPAPPVDILQVGDPWPTAGSFNALDTDSPGLSPTLNGSVDDNGSFEPELTSFSGPLTSFPVVAGAGADGVWDVTLSPNVSASQWTGLVTGLIDGTITVVAGACLIDADCDDGNTCTLNVCNAGVCEETAVVGACDDGNLCTQSDTCAGLLCVGTPIDCSGLDSTCGAGVCNGATGVCEVAATNEGGVCDDLNICTLTDLCVAGICQGTAVDCAAFDDVCNLGTCNAVTGVCEARPANEGGACDDAVPCTAPDVCASGVCGGPPVDCSGLDDGCNVGVCNALTGICEPSPINDGLACDDLDPCTLTETCQTGVCTGGLPVDCTTASDQCNVASCSAVGASGNCDTLTPVADNTVCDDGAFCTATDVCTAGVCTGSGDPCPGTFCNEVGDVCAECLVSADCDDNNLCTDDFCTLGACVRTNNAIVCDDADVCTVGDQCAGGFCAPGFPVDCSAVSDQCNVATCDPAGATGNCAIITPVINGTVCDDGDRCLVDDTCQAGMCVGSPADCSSLDDVCNVGSCNPTNGVCQAQSRNEGGACDDGLICTTNDICVDGSCEGTLAGTPLVDLVLVATQSTVRVGQVVRFDLVARSATCSDLPVATVEAILAWDSTVLSLVGKIDPVQTEWLGSAFPDDSGADGLNAPFGGSVPGNDGDVLYQAVASFQTGATVTPAGTLVTTFEFLALQASPTTSLALTPAQGAFTVTRVLGAASLLGVNLTGTLGTDSVVVTDCLLNIDCDDSNLCTTDTCVGGFCQIANNLLACDDGLFCTTGDVCSGGVCGGTGAACSLPLRCSESLDACVACLSAAHCDDGNVCTEDVCNATGSCVNPNNFVSCDDGNFCTVTDVCSGGSCVGSGDTCPGLICDEPTDRCVECLIAADCDDANPCTDDTCVSNVCVRTPNSVVCDDGLFCTAFDTCSGGACMGGGATCGASLVCNESVDVCVQCIVDADCDDDNICTTDTCLFGSCGNAANSLPCDDGLFCTPTDTCVNRVCVGAGDTCPGLLCDESGDACVECFTVLDCADDGIACTVDQCVAGSCTHDPSDPFCDDGQFCNGQEFCNTLLGCLASGNPCDSPALCDEINDLCGCQAPAVQASGSRYVDVTPLPGLTSVAIVVTGVDPGIACVNAFVQANGRLGSTPVFRTPAEWRTVHVRGEEIRPSTSYAFQTECDTGAGIDRSTPLVAQTWAWADTDNSGGLVTILDVVRIVDAFSGVFEDGVTLQAVDLWGTGSTPCVPDRGIDIIDMTSALDAFSGASLPCPNPCE